MCGSVRHCDAETTRNRLRTNKSHLQIFGQNRMNGSVRDASVFLQLHDGHSSIILKQLSHFFNQRNSGNFLTALRSNDIYATCVIYFFNLRISAAKNTAMVRKFAIENEKNNVIVTE